MKTPARINTRTAVAFAVTFAAAILGACASPPAEHFYTLEAVADGSQPAPGNSSLSILVGPVALPEMVDRPQLVLRSGTNQVRLMESQRWAESLRSAIPRVIASNLKRQWLDVTVSSTNEGATAPAKYRVAIDIVRFESMLGDAVELEARWRLQRNGKPVQAGGMAWREPVQGTGYADLAAAHDRVLASLSRQLASLITTIERIP